MDLALRQIELCQKIQTETLPPAHLGAAILAAPPRGAAMRRLLCAVLLTCAPLTSVRAADTAPRILAFRDSISAGLGLPAIRHFRSTGRELIPPRTAVRSSTPVFRDTHRGGVARLDWVLPRNRA